MQRPRILIGVLSAVRHSQRRAACLASWAAAVASVDLVFLLGDRDACAPRRRGRLLFLPCRDDYRSLPQKSTWFCRWAVRYVDFDYLFRCDDDAYVAVDRLLDAQFTSPYVGYDLGGY
ncbi:MAG: hypothetical protein AAF961_07375, partial [Planctomycetota bacterium]